ncbi:LOW QUALITY PROTEIN: hypothetical protein HID58_015201, partial [Brassica napus]
MNAYSSSICLLEGCWITPSEIPTTNVETAVRSAGGVPALRTAVSTLGGSYKLCNTYEDFPSYCGSSLQPILGIHATSCTANVRTLAQVEVEVIISEKEKKLIFGSDHPCL